jgi:hypothetical protein
MNGEAANSGAAQGYKPFNPLDKRNLGISVAEALAQQPWNPLPPTAAFVGAGIYAIYYVGDFPLYEPIARANKESRFLQPIYVGKAVPTGARKGGEELDAPTGMALSKRLAEHAASIEQTASLRLMDFFCRYLTVDDIWIPLGETLMIQKFEPLWNLVIDGFGNHDPGSGRYGGECTRWDTLHPGRSWAVKCKPNRRAAADIEAEARAFLQKKESK